MNNRKTFKLTLLAAAVASAYAVDPSAAWAAGDPVVGPVFTLPVTVSDTAFSVARTDSGVFMLGWRGTTQNGTGDYVYNYSIQSFNDDGSPLSSTIKLADNVAVAPAVLSKVAVAKDLDGDFIASWISSSPKKVYLQRFSQAGGTQGKQVTVAAAPQTLDFDWQNDTFNPMVAVDTDGDVAISWTVNPTLTFGWCWGNLYTGWIHGCFGGSSNITYVSIYNASGSTMRWKGSGTVIRKPGREPIEIPGGLLPQPGSGFLQLSNTATGSSGAVSAQRLSSHGQKAGAAWTPTDPGGTPETVPAISGAATDASGNVAIVWQTLNGSDSPVYVRRYSADGTPLGNRITVADLTSIQYYNCFFPIIEMAPSGMFAVLWGEDMGTFCGIKGQYFNTDGSPNGAAFTVTDTDYVTYYGPPAAAIDSSGNLTVVWEKTVNVGLGPVLGRTITPPH